MRQTSLCSGPSVEKFPETQSASSTASAGCSRPRPGRSCQNSWPRWPRCSDHSPILAIPGRTAVSETAHNGIHQDAFRSRKRDGLTAALCLCAILTRARWVRRSYSHPPVLRSAKALVLRGIHEKDGGNASSDTRRFPLRYRRIPGAAAAIRGGFTRRCRLPYALHPNTT